MPPGTLVGVVVGREIARALRARPPRLHRMADPQIHALLGHRDLNAFHGPGRNHAQQMPVSSTSRRPDSKSVSTTFSGVVSA